MLFCFFNLCWLLLLLLYDDYCYCDLLFSFIGIIEAGVGYLFASRGFRTEALGWVLGAKVSGDVGACCSCLGEAPCSTQMYTTL